MHFSKIILGLFLSSDILVLHSCSLPQEHTRFLDKIQSLLSVLGKYLDGAVLMIKDGNLLFPNFLLLVSFIVFSLNFV